MMCTAMRPLPPADHSRAGAAGQEGQVLLTACCAHPGPARRPLNPRPAVLELSPFTVVPVLHLEEVESPLLLGYEVTGDTLDL